MSTNGDMIEIHVRLVVNHCNGTFRSVLEASSSCVHVTAFKFPNQSSGRF